jgi:TRAP-type uncharacterized transport system fused permease subunit
MFVYEPMLLLIVKDWSAQWLDVLLAIVSASIGVIALAGGFFGWFIGLANGWQRVALVAAALLLIKPGLWTDLAGLALLALVVTSQRTQSRAQRP